MILPNFFSFLTGLVVMLIASQIFLNLAKDLSIRWNFSPLFISTVIIAFGTTLPELTVTLAAIGNNDPGLAMGNIVGSSIANITIVLGAATFFGKVRIGTNKTQKNAFILLMITTLFSILTLSAVKTSFQVLLLLLALGASFSYQYILAVKGRFNEDEALLKLMNKLSRKKKQLPKLIMFFLLIASIAGLVVGGKITVQSVQQISLELGISTTVLGLTLTALATSLPELMTSMISSKKHDNKVVVGTLMGSNTINLTIFPALILMSTIGYKIKKFISINEVFFLMLATLTFYTIIKARRGEVIEKKLSVLLITIFAVFITATFYL